MSVDLDRLDLSALASARRGTGSGDHFVEFYDDDASLVALVDTFLSGGLRQGGAVVVVAGEDHRRRIEHSLARSGIDVAAVREQGRFVSLDAEETLARFIVEGTVDEARCVDVLGSVVADAARRGAGVRIFGEMVAVLWARGDLSGAVALERVWNRLAETEAFRLFCAYPADSFGDDDAWAVRELCSHHSHVIAPA